MPLSLPTPAVPDVWGAITNANLTYLDAQGVTNAAAIALKQAAPTLSGKTLQVYGHSYTDTAVMVPGQTPTTAGMYYNRVATALGGNSPVSYGKGGMRIDFGAFGLVAAGASPGHATPVTGSVWPGVSSRPGPVVCDFLINDYAHTNGTTIPPQAITGAGGTRYAAGIAGAYEAFFAIASSESRREIFSGVTNVAFTGAGWASFGSTTYLSNSDFSWTNGAGDYVNLTSVTPPQTGPYAGKVFIGMDVFDPSSLAMANATTTVDSGTAITWTAPGWEAYAGGANQVYATIGVELPADTAGHTIKLTQSGTGYIVPDALYIPSVAPPTIYVMDTPDPIANASAWSAADIAVWKANRDIVKPLVKAAVAKYPNVVWVPTTMTPGTLWVDGIHPNDDGLARRALDLQSAINTVQLLGLPAAKLVLAA